MITIPIVAILLAFLGSKYWRKIVAKVKLKRQKNNPYVLGVRDIGELFRIREIDLRKGVCLLSLNPTQENYLGTGDPFWAKLEGIPDNFRREGSIRIIGLSWPDGVMEIIQVYHHLLPNEKDILGLENPQTAT